MAAPKRETARDGAEEKRIDDPQRKAREDNGVGKRRNLNFVVKAGFTPRLDKANAPQAPAEAEARRIYVAARPVDAARLEHRRRGSRNRRRVAIGHYEDAVHDGPRVGGIRGVVADLHLDGRSLRIAGGNAFGLYEELELAAGECDHASAAEILHGDKRLVRDDHARNFCHDFGGSGDRQRDEALEVRVCVRKLARAKRKVAKERCVGDSEDLRDLDGNAGALSKDVRVRDERVCRAKIELPLATGLRRDRRRTLRGLCAATRRLGEEVRALEKRLVAKKRKPRERAREQHLGIAAHLERYRGVEVELPHATTLERF